MKAWQVQLGGWGSIAWLGSFHLMELAKDKGFDQSATTLAGYALGFVTAFVSYLFWEVIHGGWGAILGEERGLLRIVSSIPLLFLALLGLLAFLNGIFNNSMPWFYNLSFAFAGIIVAQGLVPIINEIDGRKP